MIEDWRFKQVVDECKELRKLFNKLEAATAPARVSDIVLDRKGPAFRQIAEDRAEQVARRFRTLLWNNAEQTEMTPLYIAWRNGTATAAEKDRLTFLTLKGLFQA